MEKVVKTICGRIGNKTISEVITNYNPNISAMIPTAKENIRKKFIEQGEDPKKIIFDD